jgi:hypothetical protein
MTDGGVIEPAVCLLHVGRGEIGVPFVKSSDFAYDFVFGPGPVPSHFRIVEPRRMHRVPPGAEDALRGRMKIGMRFANRLRVERRFERGSLDVSDHHAGGPALAEHWSFSMAKGTATEPDILFGSGGVKRGREVPPHSVTFGGENNAVSRKIKGVCGKFQRLAMVTRGEGRG